MSPIITTVHRVGATTVTPTPPKHRELDADSGAMTCCRQWSLYHLHPLPAGFGVAVCEDQHGRVQVDKSARTALGRRCWNLGASSDVLSKAPAGNSRTVINCAASTLSVMANPPIGAQLDRPSRSACTEILARTVFARRHTPYCASVEEARNG